MIYLRLTKLFRLAPIGLLMVMCLTCIGCEAPGFARYVIAGPPKIKAVYTLEQRPTLVIVDDPKNLLGDPNFPAVVGANVGFHLKKQKVLPQELIVSQDHLSVLAAEMGDSYSRTPIDQIGRRLDAQQVIHVQVLSVSMQADNTYYRPTARVQVKVVDVATGKRLFPATVEHADSRSTSPGHALKVELPHQTLDEARRTAMPMLARSLAERVGLEVAQLFYNHIDPDDEPKT